MSGTSIREKHLENFSKVFFQVFLRLVLATCTRLDSVTKIACFVQNGSVFEPFSVFPRTFLTIHLLPYLKLSQTHHVTLKRTSIFASFHSQIFMKKVWVLSFTLHLSHLLHMSFGLCVSTDICISLDCLWVSIFQVKSWCDFWCLYTDLLYIELIFSH